MSFRKASNRWVTPVDFRLPRCRRIVQPYRCSFAGNSHDSIQNLIAIGVVYDTTSDGKNWAAFILGELALLRVLLDYARTKWEEVGNARGGHTGKIELRLDGADVLVLEYTDGRLATANVIPMTDDEGQQPNA